jgi:hypothetical protein
MPPEPRPGYKPSQESVALLCERLQRMGVSMSEPAARSLLESVLTLEGARLDALTRGTLQASLEAIRKAADAALIALTGTVPELPRRDYELSFPPAAAAIPPSPESVSVSGQRRRVQPPRPAPLRKDEPPEQVDEGEPRPVFKRRRGR